MASISGGGGILTTTDPFLDVNRHEEGPLQVSAAGTFGGVVVAEMEIPAGIKVLRIPVITSTDLATLDAIIDEGGEVVVDPGGTGTPFRAVIAGRKLGKWEPFSGPYPAGGGTKPETVTQTRVDLTFYLMGE